MLTVKRLNEMRTIAVNLKAEGQHSRALLVGLLIDEHLKLMKQKKEVYYYRESFIQSFLSDLVTYGGLVVCLYLSGDDLFWKIVFAIMFFVLFVGTGSKRRKVFTSKNKMIEHVKKTVTPEVDNG